MIRKLEHDAQLTAKGCIRIKVNFVIQIKKHNTINCTSRNDDLFNPKLIALFGIMLLNLVCIKKIKFQVIVISNLELPNFLGLKLRGISIIFNFPLLISSKSYKT